jgi:hypothetical protein
MRCKGKRLLTIKRFLNTVPTYPPALLQAILFYILIQKQTLFEHLRLGQNLALEVDQLLSYLPKLFVRKIISRLPAFIADSSPLHQEQTIDCLTGTYHRSTVPTIFYTIIILLTHYQVNYRCTIQSLSSKLSSKLFFTINS